MSLPVHVKGDPPKKGGFSNPQVQRDVLQQQGHSSQHGGLPTTSSHGGGYPSQQQRDYPSRSEQPPPYPGPPLSQQQFPLEQPPPYPGSPEPSQFQQPWTPNQNTCTGNEGPTYQWDNVPDVDPGSDMEFEEEQLPQPSAPTLQNVQGYENVGLNTGGAVPPPVHRPPSEEQRPVETYVQAAIISKDEARDAMLQFVGSHCCYGSRPAKQMNITNILPSSALHYSLETFTERRLTSREYQPYRGEPVDGPAHGSPPRPWEVDVQPDRLFSDHTKQTEVPHTSTVHGCHRCISQGFVRCGRCFGRGRVRCSICRGASGRTKWVHERGRSRQVKEQTCYACDGNGSIRCVRCSGDGRVVCPVCQGFRSLRWFIRLTVEFTNNLNDYIYTMTGMPDHLIRDVGGVVLMEQASPYVWPISSYHVREINENSMLIVNSHRNSWRDRRTLQQRQRLRGVPVSVVHYKWKDLARRFWVYGNERRVHSPDYPHQCCCGCSIL